MEEMTELILRFFSQEKNKMKRNFSKKISGNIKGFVGVSRKFIPYAGLKHTNKGNSQSITASPLRKTVYTKTKIGNQDFKTKTNIDTGYTKFKLKKNKLRGNK